MLLFKVFKDFTEKTLLYSVCFKKVNRSEPDYEKPFVNKTQLIII